VGVLRLRSGQVGIVVGGTDDPAEKQRCKVIRRRVLLRELDEQVRPASCVLIIAGMYVAHSYWIKKEIDMLQRLPATWRCMDTSKKTSCW